MQAKVFVEKRPIAAGLKLGYKFSCRTEFSNLRYVIITLDYNYSVIVIDRSTFFSAPLSAREIFRRRRGKISCHAFLLEKGVLRSHFRYFSRENFQCRKHCRISDDT